MTDALSPRRLMPALAGVLIAAQPAFADDRAELVDFFAGQGCAIGPTTRVAAMAVGFAPEQIDALAQEEAARPGAVAGGDWVVMAPETCTMRPPEIGGELHLSDPEVVAAISAPDAYLDQDSPGCFLDYQLLEALQASRGWNADRANLEYMQLIARSVISGEMTFYSESNLMTPMGFQLTTGACGDAAPLDKIQRSHAFLIRNFDPIMRGYTAENLCEGTGNVFLMVDANTLPGVAAGTSTSNAWTTIEAEFIAVGAGWFEGMTAVNKGLPRPPLCQYAELLPVDDSRAANRKARRN